MQPDPNRAIAALHMAEAARLLRAGRPADALAPLREAALLCPGDAAILHDYGLASLECGRIEDAIAILRRAAAANPRFADTHLRLGIALEAAGALEDALAAYRKSAALQPSLADARYREGELLDSLSRSEEAAAAFRRAAAAAPGTMPGRIAAARARLAENRDAEAETILRQALALEPGHAAALELLGNLLADTGRFAEARDTLLQAIARAPARAGSYYDVVRCRPIGPGDAALLERIRAAAAFPGLDPVQRSRVHLALGKAEDDLGRHEAAMAHFDAAEALRNGLVRFDPAAFEALVERVITCFTPELFARGAGPACRDAAPVLIMGLPRSGTTLLEQILSSHPAVAPGGELPFWNERGLQWQAIRGDVADASLSLAAKSAPAYQKLLRGIGGKAARVTDKNPLNFIWAGLIHLAFPHATIIHCDRDALDTALSIHQTHFTPRMAFPTGGAALVAYVRAARRLCAHWRRVLPPAIFVTCDYAALTAAPDAEIARIVAACGLQWDPACLHPDRNTRAVRTPSKWQARQTIYRSAVGRWRAYEPWLGPLGALLEDDAPDGTLGQERSGA